MSGPEAVCVYNAGATMALSMSRDVVTVSQQRQKLRASDALMLSCIKDGVRMVLPRSSLAAIIQICCMDRLQRITAADMPWWIL